MTHVVQISNSFSCIHCTISFEFTDFPTVPVYINLFKYYSVYNATFQLSSTPRNPDDNCTITFNCSQLNPQYFRVITSGEARVEYLNCNYLFNDTAQVEENNNNTLQMVDEIFDLINNITKVYMTECDDSDTSYTFDTGYPLLVENEIVNDELYGQICCRGSQSCASTDTIKTNVGNILCLAKESCATSSLVWTDDTSINLNGGSISGDVGSIFCVASNACIGSTLDSANLILCTAKDSCKNSVILGAKKLYCSTGACLSAVIRNCEEIYFVDEQEGANIYSGQIGTTKIYFKGENSGYGISYHCNDGDECYIDCSTSGSCSKENTLLYCYGKCFVTCDDTYDDESVDCVTFVTSLDPSVAPTGAPTLVPTFEPTDSKLVTEEEISYYFNWILIGIAVVTILLIVFGTADAGFARKNQVFDSKAIFSFAFYSNDFISDIFFILKLYLLSFDEVNTYNQEYYFILLILSMAFVIIPLISNIIQLHFEILKWRGDSILKQTGVIKWIRSNVKLLFFVSVVCGSSFSAIALCNSYLLQLGFFSMGLSRYHRAIFQNKRFFSIVLLENIPQLCIQITTLVLVFGDPNNTGASGQLVTILSMIFTIISILLSVFEYVFSSKSIKSDNVAIIRFNIESQTIANFTYKKFISKIAYRPIQFTHCVAKTLQLNKNEVEALMPSQYKSGVIFNFIVEFDDSSHYLQIEKTIKDLTNINSLINEASKIYNIKDMSSDNDNDNDTDNEMMSEVTQTTQVTMVKLKEGVQLKDGNGRTSAASTSGYSVNLRSMQTITSETHSNVENSEIMSDNDEK